MAAVRATLVVPWVALILGIGATAGVTARVRARDDAVAAARFEWRARAHLAAIQRAVDADVVLVEAVAGVFNASERVTREEFARFLRDVVALRTDVTAVEWAPAVREPDRARFVAAAAAEGLRGFEILAVDADGQLVPAPPAEVHAPVWFVAPHAGNEAVVGYDLTSEPTRAEAVALARDTGAVVATRPIGLVQSPGVGFLVVKAVYEGGRVPTSVAERRAALAGWAVAAVDLTQLVSGALAAPAGGGIRATVYDAEDAGRVLLDATTGGGQVVFGDPEAAPGLAAEPQVRLALELPGRLVAIAFRPGGEEGDPIEGGAVWVAVGGIALSLGLASWLYAEARRAVEARRLTEVLEARVKERTRELQATADRLSAEGRERARAEAAERVGRAHLEALLQHFPGAVWMATAGSPVTVLTALGAHVGAFGLARPPLALPEDGTPLGAITRAHRAAAAGSASTVEVEREGRVFEVRVTPAVGLGDGATIAVALDVTERRRLEAERMEAHLLRAQKLESLGVLAGGIAHDFNNLLVGIIGNASLLELRLREGSPELDLLRRIEAAGQQAAVLTRQMLAYSGRGHFVIEPTDMNAVVRELGELVLASVSKKITLEWALAPTLPRIQADVAQIRQVFLNLVTNAADAVGAAPGRVRVGTRVEHLDEERLAATILGAGLPPGPYVLLEVSDTGCGMDADTMRRMFDPFFTTKPTGHGLGLAATLGILRGHRGTVEVHSAPGEGTTILAWFPAAEGRAPVEVPPEVPPAPAQALRVLVIDDEEGVRSLVAAALEARGDVVVAAPTGEDGLARATADPDGFDVVILDLTLPGLDGADVLARLVELRPDLPVLVSSGYTEREVPRMEGVRYAGFLQKPYTIQSLRGAVDRVVRVEGATPRTP